MNNIKPLAIWAEIKVGYATPALLVLAIASIKTVAGSRVLLGPKALASRNSPDFSCQLRLGIVSVLKFESGRDPICLVSYSNEPSCWSSTVVIIESPFNPTQNILYCPFLFKRGRSNSDKESVVAPILRREFPSL